MEVAARNDLTVFPSHAQNLVSVFTTSRNEALVDHQPESTLILAELELNGTVLWQ